MITIAGQTISILEAVAVATGLISVWLARHMHVANWPVGLVNVACFAVLFLDAKLYAGALLQVAMFGLGVYGWHSWRRAKQRAAVLQPTRAKASEVVLVLVLGVLGTAASARFLIAFTDSPVPVRDAATLAFSLLATWTQARRRIECWLIWIGVDLISIPLYWSRGLPLTTILYVVFLLICVAAFAHWKSRLPPALAR